MDRYRLASRAYLIYGVIYWLGGAYLATQGVGVRGGRVMQAGVVWIVLGLVFVVLVPYLLARPRAWFERWILTRRDFARVYGLQRRLRDTRLPMRLNGRERRNIVEQVGAVGAEQIAAKGGEVRCDPARTERVRPEQRAIRGP